MENKNHEQIYEELFNKLVEIEKNKDFVQGVLANAPHPEDQQAIIDFIDKGEGVTVESIITLSVLLDDEREKPK